MGTARLIRGQTKGHRRHMGLAEALAEMAAMLEAGKFARRFPELVG